MDVQRSWKIHENWHIGHHLGGLLRFWVVFTGPRILWFLWFLESIQKWAKISKKSKNEAKALPRGARAHCRSMAGQPRKGLPGLKGGTALKTPPKWRGWHVWVCCVASVEPLVLGCCIVSSMFSVSPRCCLPANKLRKKCKKLHPKWRSGAPFWEPGWPKWGSGAPLSEPGWPSRRRTRNRRGGLSFWTLLASPLRSHFGPKSIKNTIEKSLKNPPRKNIENNAKRLPKWNRNRCQSSLKINAKSDNKERRENHEKTVFLKGFKLYFERRTQYCCSKTRFAVFDSGAMSVCIHDEKSMKNPSLNRCKIDGTSVQNQSSKK